MSKDEEFKLTLSADKKIVLKQILQWLEFKTNKQQYLTVGGYAGTGKTTLIAVLRRLLYKKDPKLKVAFAAFTGKATRVLQNYLTEFDLLYKQDSISTIHSLIYSVVENEQQQIVAWRKKDRLKVDLIIIDEASMLDREIWLDLLSYQIPILAVGDHGQLPPIHGYFNLMKEPILRLESIHRQEINNPIIAVSILARTQGEIPVASYGPKVKKLLKTDPETGEQIENYLQMANEDTLIVCGYNNTRLRLNQYLRSLKGFEEEDPQPGDRVICLRNNHQKQIYNGMLGTIERIRRADKNFFELIVDFDDQNFAYEGLAVAKQFNSPKTISFNSQDRQLLKKADLFDFAYALTVHKAQGSQAKRVIVFEERFKQMDDEGWRRWLYTAVTRAEEELIIIGD
ncbi:MAG: AAA family ATPase [Candidatus Pacebacteria bacterium]|jgi:exodeoxyribonuclease-5|nr:AAA family ATPase [Candidatus Paceibacterota bacterium]